MPEGLNRSGDFRNGTPVTLPKNFGTPITSLTPAGNPIPTSGTEQNIVNWLPDPAHFGNRIGPSQQATPTFSPATGTYTGAQTVTITSVGADAVYYTTDGSTPTTASPVYSAPITVSSSETVKALAVKSGVANSDIGSAAYVINSAAPTLVSHVASQQAGSFTQPAPTAPIDTTGADFLVVGINSYDSQHTAFIGGYGSLVADGVGFTPKETASAAITGIVATDTSITVSGTFDASADSNGWVGLYLCLQGQQTSGLTAMNGYWVITASSTTSVTASCAVGTTTTNTSTIYAAQSSNAWVFVAAPISQGGSPGFWASYSPTVGAGHVFIEDDFPVTGAGDGSSFAVAAFSGVGTFVGHSAGTVSFSGNTVQDASYAPAQANNLLISCVTGLAITGPTSVDSGFAITDAWQTASNKESPIGLAYLVTADTSPVQPTWTLGTVGNRSETALVEFAHA